MRFTTVETFEATEGHALIVRPPSDIPKVRAALEENGFSVERAEVVGDITVNASHQEIEAALGGVAFMTEFYPLIRS